MQSIKTIFVYWEYCHIMFMLTMWFMINFSGVKRQIVFLDTKLNFPDYQYLIGVIKHCGWENYVLGDDKKILSSLCSIVGPLSRLI